MTISTSRAVAEVLQASIEPLTVAEIVRRIEPLGAARTARPQATVRSALFENQRIATLGGRPARYVWWPNTLQGCYFRQPLTQMDFETGELPLTVEVWSALWPDFYAAHATPVPVSIELDGGPTLAATVEHLRERKPIWGLAGEPQLAAWCRALRATRDDDLIFTVLDTQQKRYRVSLQRRDGQDAAALRLRDEHLLRVAMDVVAASREGLLLHYELVPRLVARGFYRSSLPPGPLAPLLRADLRFVVSGFGHVSLTARLVMRAESERSGSGGPWGDDRPPGDWLTPREEEERRAWGRYLFDRGMEYRGAENDRMAEAHYRAALMVDRDHADAWVHVGNIRFEEDLVGEALQNYLTAETAALARTIGDPARYQGPFWLDLDSRPYMHALHGQGLALWRLGRSAEAAAVFRRQLALNPNDNQGVRFLLPDVEAGLTWEASSAISDGAMILLAPQLE